MASHWQDQAAGLRQLVAASICRSVGFTGGRGDAGTTTVVVNLAAALFERSRDVLVLDEFEGHGNICRRLHLQASYDFEQVLRRETSLAECLLDSGRGFQILPVTCKPQTLAALNERELQWLAAEFEELANQTDYLLLDTRPAMSHGIPSLSLATDDVVIVLSNRAESLTDAYATIKLLATTHGRHDFRILVNRVANLEEAGALFGRVREVARQYLGEAIHLRLIGFVPENEELHRASRLGQTVLEAFPDSEAATAFRQLADAMLRWAPARHSHDSPAGLVHRLVESSRLLTEQLKH